MRKRLWNQDNQNRRLVSLCTKGKERNGKNIFRYCGLFGRIEVHHMFAWNDYVGKIFVLAFVMGLGIVDFGLT